MFQRIHATRTHVSRGLNAVHRITNCVIKSLVWSLIKNGKMKYKLVKVYHIKQQYLWKGLWNTWRIPLMALYELALLWIIITVIQN